VKYIPKKLAWLWVVYQIGKHQIIAQVTCK